MGRDKAAIRVQADPSGLTLASRAAGLLSEVCAAAVEVGPGHTPLPRVVESSPGQGPLYGVVAGWRALGEGGWKGPVLVVATDLPNLTGGMLGWLAGQPGDGSVVPVAHGRVQPLCARYSPADLDTAARLVAGGDRAMTALLSSIDACLAPEESWAPAAGGVAVLLDVDTPEDLRRVTGG